jgi:hypothetical protein
VKCVLQAQDIQSQAQVREVEVIERGPLREFAKVMESCVGGDKVRMVRFISDLSLALVERRSKEFRRFSRVARKTAKMFAREGVDYDRDTVMMTAWSMLYESLSAVQRYLIKSLNGIIIRAQWIVTMPLAHDRLIGIDIVLHSKSVEYAQYLVASTTRYRDAEFNIKIIPIAATLSKTSLTLGSYINKSGIKEVIQLWSAK